MMVLSSILFVSELSIGYKTGSLALIGDAFHMISDTLSLLIAFVATRMSKNSVTEQHTYGWQRSEVIGSFINGVFLLSVSLFIAMEAIQRFIEVPSFIFFHDYL
uniref:Cation efflux protein transmembrane domain-containing protein n=1 Tax=Arcella intermedia TaxID=1963864 RepID=A0A6B2LU71_9EUKA